MAALTPDSETNMFSGPERGIAITTPELASEGTDAVLDAIAGTGANAITTTTSIANPTSVNTGLREPPLDVAGEHRLLDRPIWGGRSTWIERYVAHPPDPNLWRDLPWSPPPLAPEHARVDLAREAIDAARARALRVYAHFAPYALPGGPDHRDGMPTNDELRLQFRPTRFIGGVHADGISYTGCLNNPVVRHYGRVRLIELLRHYGDIDGIALDWVEFPTYFLDKLFTCFCEHCRERAGALGYDWDMITGSVRVHWDSLHTLTQDQLESLVRSGDWGELVPDPDAMLAGFAHWLEFKAASVADAIHDLRQVMRHNGAGAMLVATGEFALPWGRMSGAAYAAVGGVDSQRVKLNSSHWLMMVNWWAETLLRWNRGSALTPDIAARAVLSLFGIELEQAPEELRPDLFGMPYPEQSHNLTAASYTHRLENAIMRRPDQAPLMPALHAYRQASDLARLLEALRPFSEHGLWIQRYGYLSDEKLEILRQEWSRS
jgi:hypothetical protein